MADIKYIKMIIKLTYKTILSQLKSMIFLIKENIKNG